MSRVNNVHFFFNISQRHLWMCLKSKDILYKLSKIQPINTLFQNGRWCHLAVRMMSNLRTLRTERSLTAVYKAVVVLHFWFVTSCRWESELETWRSSLLRPGFLIQPDMMPYLCFDKTIQPQAASNSTLLHASSFMIYSQAFKLHKNNSWRTQPRKKSFDILLLVVLALYGGTCCFIKKILSIHSTLPWKRLKATLPIYVNRRREKKTKMGGKTERSIHW